MFPMCEVFGLVHGVFGGQADDGLFDLQAVCVEIVGDQADALGDDGHILRREAARCGGGRADADAAGQAGLLRVVRDGVFVDRDMNLVELILKLFARDAPA